jgi:type II secretory pathway pseudopilin PulG
MTICKQRRTGFTIIELLVSMALIMTIMAILSAAFVSGLDTFGKLRATADMAQKLRLAASTLRRDLKADHFDAALRPSDPGFMNTIIPREGFIRVYQGGMMMEGTSDGVPSYLANNHVLHLGVKLRGNRPEDFFVANVPSNAQLMNNSTFFNQPADARYQTQPTQYCSQWAEVVYFLVPLGKSTSPGSPQQPLATQPLYALYRVQRLAVANNTGLGAAAGGQAAYSSMSINPANGNFNTPADWTTIANRSFDPTNQVALQAVATTDNLILSNVLSFTVRPMTPQGTAMPAPGNIVANWDSAGPPVDPNSGLPFQLYGVEISIRIWDLKAQQARQITIIQDL